MSGYIKQSELAGWREKHMPWSCPILGHAEFTPVVDHDHYTGRIRGVISSEGNVLIGKAENFYRSRCKCADQELPDVLRNIADYLEQPQGPLHPHGVRQLTRRFQKQGKGLQVATLLALGLEVGTIAAASNAKQRGKLYREALIDAHSQ